jgi:hypothetical protein
MTAGSKTLNIYCDESCHLEASPISVMAWGAMICDVYDAREIGEQIRALKLKHGLAANFEAKWTKVSPAKTDFYLALVNFFLEDERLRFRGLVVPDKGCLDHARYGQTHDDWYYKMYYTMLQWIIQPPNHYRIYLDVKDTRGGEKTRKLHEVLANKFHDFEREYIERVQQIRSHESEILQLTDLMIGALTYFHRGLRTSTTKAAIIERLQEVLGKSALAQTSSFGATKFNLLIWNRQEAAE